MCGGSTGRVLGQGKSVVHTGYLPAQLPLGPRTSAGPGSCWPVPGPPGPDPATGRSPAGLHHLRDLRAGQGHHGYTGQRGYHPLLAVAAGTGDVLMSRLREGRSNTARGAAQPVGRVRYAGARGQLCGPTAASTPMSMSPSGKTKALLHHRPPAQEPAQAHQAIPEDAWRPIPYWMEGAADVAESTYTPFRSQPDAAPVRLIVRRVKPAPGSQLALFYSITPSSPTTTATPWNWRPATAAMPRSKTPSGT